MSTANLRSPRKAFTTGSRSCTENRGDHFLHVLRAPCSVLRAPCSVLRAPCSVLQIPRSLVTAKAASGMDRDAILVAYSAADV